VTGVQTCALPICAELKSQFLSQFAAEVIRTEFPQLASKMLMHTAVLNWRSRALEEIAAD